MSHPRIFICYRRDDSGTHAHRLHDSLAAKLGAGAVFIDLQTPGGAHVGDYLTRTIGSTAILLIVIGPKWLSLRDARGRRLDNDDDYVRLEILTAREQGAVILPVRVAGAEHPAVDALPADLRFLADINSLTIGEGAHWRTDVDRLAATTAEILHPGRRRRRLPIAVSSLVAVVVLAAVVAGALLRGEPSHAASLCGDGPGDPAHGIYCVVNPCEEYPAPCRLPKYDSPKRTSPVGTLEDDERVHVLCQVKGERYDGHHGVSTDIWDRLADGTYVSDYFVNTDGRGAFDPALPPC